MRIGNIVPDPHPHASPSPTSPSSSFSSESSSSSSSIPTRIRILILTHQHLYLHVYFHRNSFFVSSIRSIPASSFSLPYSFNCRCCHYSSSRYPDNPKLIDVVVSCEVCFFQKPRPRSILKVCLGKVHLPHTRAQPRQTGWIHHIRVRRCSFA